MKKIQVILLGVLAWACAGAVAQTYKPGQVKAQRSKENSWATAQWTSNNSAYRRMRSNVAQAANKGQSLDVLVRRYRGWAAKKPWDAQAQFRWAAAAYEAASASRPFDKRKIVGVAEAMDGAAKPYSYEYARLRFLVGAADFTWPHFKEMKAAGERLHQAYPRDIDVLWQFTYVLSCSMDIKDRQRAIAMSRELVRSDPDNANYRANLAGTYVGLWNLTNRRLGRDEAIAQYREYLRLAPLDAPFRPRAEYMIKLLQGQEPWKERAK